jgi:hypothetical protein
VRSLPAPDGSVLLGQLRRTADVTVADGVDLVLIEIEARRGASAKTRF